MKLELRENGVLDVLMEEKRFYKEKFLMTLNRLGLSVKTYNTVLQDLMKPYLGNKVADFNAGSVLACLLEEMGDNDG